MGTENSSFIVLAGYDPSSFGGTAKSIEASDAAARANELIKDQQNGTPTTGKGSANGSGTSSAGVGDQTVEESEKSDYTDTKDNPSKKVRIPGFRIY
ncbi:MAG: hypothetical protein ACR2O0_15165 [Rhizobiaceae bacterium]